MTAPPQVPHVFTSKVSATKKLAAEAKEDFAKFAYYGFGVMLSDEQLEARELIGPFGPRQRGEPKFNFLSGGQRGGKTVFLALEHADAGLYKRGVDTTDETYWKNYLYKTLAIAPTTELTLKLWTVMDELSKNASDAQWDPTTSRARRGLFCSLLKCGKLDKWATTFYEWGARTDFRSSEGIAYRLEGDQWWGITWDEWASQPDREIQKVLTDVLLGRSRDHDAKIIPAAWPKAETERHLIAVQREIESGRRTADPKQIIYISSEAAFFTNRKALETERGMKDDATWQRTVLGRPAGGASIEFPADVVENMVVDDLTWPQLPEAGFRYFNSWDLGLGHDDTVGIVWRIPMEGVTPWRKARIVNVIHLPGGPSLTIDHVTHAITREQMVYNADSALDAAAMGGLATVRQLRELQPTPLEFVARSHDRFHGNMRIASIANGLELLTWERKKRKPDEPAGKGRMEQVVDELAEQMHLEQPPEDPWGVVESPRITELIDQLANFDRDAPKGKKAADDWVASFLIGLWYIRKYWVQGNLDRSPKAFDTRMMRSSNRPFHTRGR